MMNINLAIIKGAKVLKENFFLNSYLDSEILMTHVIKKDREYLLSNQNKDLSMEDFKNFYELIINRSNGNPIAYLTNKKFF